MAKLKYTLLNNNFLSLPEIRVLKNKFKSQGVLAVIACYLAMSGAANASLSPEEVEIIALDEGVRDFQDWLNYCISKNLLILELGNYTNKHVKKDQESYGKKLESDRKRKGIGSESMRNCDRNRCDPDIDIVIDNDLNNKLRLSGKFNTPEIKKAVTAWREKQRKQGRDYDQIQLEAHCITFNTPEKFLEALNFSLGLSKTYNIHAPPEKPPDKQKKQINSVPTSESMHPAVRAQREREAAEALEKLNMGGLLK